MAESRKANQKKVNSLKLPRVFSALEDKLSLFKATNPNGTPSTSMRADEIRQKKIDYYEEEFKLAVAGNYRKYRFPYKTLGEKSAEADSLICDGYNKIPVSALKGQKIIKPKDIEIDYRMLESLLCDLNPNPYEILDIVKRREFSHKIAECIWRLEEISFTEHDYNRFVKQAKSALEKLDKEHYKYL